MFASDALRMHVLRAFLRNRPFAARLACLARAGRATITTMDTAAVSRVVDSAVQARPSLAVDRDAFARHVADRVDQDALEEVHAADLLLAFACANHDRKAIDELERCHLVKIPDFVHRIERSGPAAAEIQQIVRERLLVGTSKSGPKILEYAGRGSLGSWIRVVSIRVALEVVRSRKPEVHDDDATARDMVTSADPELDYLRVRYASAFREAFSGALAALDERDRTVLQLYLVDGLNIEKIGQLYQVHRATVARWISTTRDQLYDETHARLRQQLNLNATEFESIVRLVRSQLDVSVRRILQEGQSGT